ncbi:MAG: LamG domain-containing protein [Planctomycetota bacterium JB042]
MTRAFASTIILLLAAGLCRGDVGSCGEALALDGDGDFVSVPGAPELQNATAITLEAWIHPTSKQNGRILSKGDGVRATTDRSFDLTYRGNGTAQLWLFFGPQGQDKAVVLETSETIPVGAWTHVAAVFDSSAGLAVLYVDSVPKVTKTTSADGGSLAGLQVRQSTRPVTIGHTPPWDTTFVHGWIDEARIWSTARSQVEIAQNMESELDNVAGLAAAWHFNGDATDATGAHDGALQGDAGFVMYGPQILSYGQGCPGAGGFVPALELSGCAGPGKTVELSITSGLGGAPTLLLVGQAQASVDAGAGCTLLVAPVALTLTFPLSGTGNGMGNASLPITVPPAASGVTATAQAFVIDSTSRIGAAGSNGVQLDIP